MRPFHKRLEQTVEIIAEDGCRLRELIHPQRDAPSIDYSLAQAEIDPGQSTLNHRLTEEDELYYFVEGTGTMTIDDESFAVIAGDTVWVPRGVAQYVTNDGDLTLRWLNIVSPPWLLEHDQRIERK